MLKRIGTTACAVFLIGTALAHADPGILPPAEQEGTTMDSLITLGVIVFGMVAVTFISWCVAARGGRSVKRPADSTSALLFAVGALLTAPSLAYALEYEVADATRTAEHTQGGIDITSAIVLVCLLLLFLFSLHHPSRQPSSADRREAAPIE